MELLNHMVAHPQARVTLRRMLSQAGRSVQALKPCFMMGPQAVAQYLEPSVVKFDVVVMDEASQLKPEEAIGAIARGKQLIVVGDPKQLPPTSFFDRLGTTSDDGEEQAAAVDSESILDVCMGHFHPRRTLRWHYRSRHESLIAFSNGHFYRNCLIVFPSPYGKSKHLGLRYRYVQGAVYESQMNRAEAARVVDAAIDHMVDHADDSLGIVTLNLKQRDLIEELLDQRCRNLPKTDEFKRAGRRARRHLYLDHVWPGTEHGSGAAELWPDQPANGLAAAQRPLYAGTQIGERIFVDAARGHRSGRGHTERNEGVARIPRVRALRCARQSRADGRGRRKRFRGRRKRSPPGRWLQRGAATRGRWLPHRHRR
ncbi:MAG: hypothetical protein DMF60_14935 [Acidobacteria bacterium]|nr:MAG: hypothetical protein DMF60_14935 [Acidobacteriota bacterium]